MISNVTPTVYMFAMGLYYITAAAGSSTNYRRRCNVAEIRGLDRLVIKIDNLRSLRAVKAALRASAVHVKGKIARYPQASEANDPSQRRWYERNYGPRWRRRDGSIGGRKTSQTLGKRWAISERNQGLTQVIGNNADYAPFVQDADRQAWFHKQRDWPTAQGVLEDETPTILRFIEDYVEKDLQK